MSWLLVWTLAAVLFLALALDEERTGTVLVVLFMAPIWVPLAVLAAPFVALGYLASALDRVGDWMAARTAATTQGLWRSYLGRVGLAVGLVVGLGLSQGYDWQLLAGMGGAAVVMVTVYWGLWWLAYRLGWETRPGPESLS